MNKTLIDIKSIIQSEIPEEFSIKELSEIDVIVSAPKWPWIAKACHSVPEGKCIVFPVPEKYTILVFMKNMRAALAQHPLTRHDKLSIRQSKNKEYVVVFKSGVWEEFYKTITK